MTTEASTPPNTSEGTNVEGFTNASTSGSSTRHATFRGAATSAPWGVMVSEFMLQQTPVKRVLPVWEEWMRRWPPPLTLPPSPTSEAVRAWGRLELPRRARAAQCRCSDCGAARR